MDVADHVDARRRSARVHRRDEDVSVSEQSNKSPLIRQKKEDVRVQLGEAKVPDEVTVRRGD